MAPKAKGESSRGLIVTLVFFVLTTIGGGLAGYYGFADQANLKKAKKEAEDKTKLADQDRDANRYLVALMKHHLGNPPAPDSPYGRELADKAKYDSGDRAPSDQKEAAEFKDTIAKLNARAAWDAAKGAPKSTLDDIIKTRDTEIADLKVKLQKAEEERLLAQASKAATQQDRTKDQAAFAEAIKNKDKGFVEDLNRKDGEIAKLTDLLKEVENKKDEKVVKPLEEQIKQLQADKGALAKQIKDLNDKLAAAVPNVPAATAAAEGKPTDPKPRGKITRVHLDRRKVSIDLGKIHGLTSQTTFAVHGYQANGKPRVRSKANVEVISVGQSTSECLVTEIFHPDPDTDHVSTGKRKVIDVLHKDNTDPIIPGDALINPLWNPNAKTHIAIAGMIDLYGTGAINMASLVQILERQNIIVDAYVDPLDGSIKGKGVSRRTEYVLLGIKPTGREPGTPKDEATLKAIGDSIDKVLAEAKQYAVPQKQPHAFFRETGFNMPRTITSD